MDEPKKVDHVISVLAVALTASVFVLDVMTPLGIAMWALYVLPLGPTRWSPFGPLTFIVAGACTALIVLGSLLSSRCLTGCHDLESYLGCAHGVDHSGFPEVREDVDRICGVP